MYIVYMYNIILIIILSVCYINNTIINYYYNYNCCIS